MNSTSIAFALAVALAGTAHADVPADGILVATQTSYGTTGVKDTLTIQRVKPTGIEKLYSVTMDVSRDYGWADARTLWIKDHDGEGNTSLEKFVDGKLADTVKVGLADWKVPGLKADDFLVGGDLLITKKGQVWLEHCLKHMGAEYGEGKCIKRALVRVDAKPFATATKRPKDVDAYRVVQIFQKGAPLAFPKAKAPAGFAMKLGKVTVEGQKYAGATCKGPQATSRFPDPAHDDTTFAMKPSKVTWLRTTPAVVKLAGKAINPVGMIEHHEAFYVDCTRVQNVEFFGGGLWGIYRQTSFTSRDGAWTLYLDDKVIGTLPGEHVRFAPR